MSLKSKTKQQPVDALHQQVVTHYADYKMVLSFGLSSCQYAVMPQPDDTFTFRRFVEESFANHRRLLVHPLHIK
jgi:hypothetical protein